MYVGRRDECYVFVGPLLTHITYILHRGAYKV